MSMRAKATGAIGERMAADYLRKKGYDIVAMNYMKRDCEADIIARDGETLVVIEVKTRSSESMGHAGEAITISKKRRVTRAALYYIQENALDNVPVRFDALLILLGGAIEHIVGAFDAQL